MKTAATAILALSGLGLAIFLVRFAACGVEVPPGLLNPCLRIELPPGRQAQLLALFLWVLSAAYFYCVVAWVELRFQENRSGLFAAMPEHGVRQPPEVKRLKDAIRAGDVPAIREYADEDALAFRDERLLTPWELAELYGDEAVIAAVREAYRRRPGQQGRVRFAGVPASRFAMGQRLESGMDE